ncbi:MAG TPA: exodeoxyribonuclease III, partial [Polyangiaceae bacterium]
KARWLDPEKNLANGAELRACVVHQPRPACGPAMRIASWNVNSIRARLGSLTRWLDAQQPDVLLLQETKVIDDDFPNDELLRRGYSTVFAGGKSYNGVAILSQRPIRDVTIGFPDDGPEADKRLITATIQGLRISSAYIPNGKDIAHPAFEEKLVWLTRLRSFLAEQRQKNGLPVIVGGDFNVAHGPKDVWSAALLEGQLHFHPRERAQLDELISLGLFDSFRCFCDAAERYSWWDYRGTSVARNRGLRIDYLFIDEALRARCTAAGIDSDTRYWDKPSDHVPVWIELSD